MNTVRWRWLAALSVGLLLSVGCAPDEPPAGWTSTRWAFDVTDPGEPYLEHDVSGAWTSNDWLATVEFEWTDRVTAADLVIRPRIGAGHRQLGAPQRLALPATWGAAPSSVYTRNPWAAPVGGDQVIALSDYSNVQFYRATGGTWGAAGTFSLPTIDLGIGGLFGTPALVAMTDDWMVLQNRALYFQTGTYAMYRLDRTGATVTATLSATLPGGTALDIDGDIAVIGHTSYFGGAGNAEVYRYDGSSWVLVHTTATGSGVARGVAVDDGPFVDRVVLTATAGDNSQHLEVLADHGSGFAGEQTLGGPLSWSWYPSTASFGFDDTPVVIDGDTIVATGARGSVPASAPSSPLVATGSLAVFRLGDSGWQRETTLEPVAPPYDAGVTSVLPGRISVSGGHIATSVLLTYAPSAIVPTQQTTGFETWAFERP